MPANPQNIPEIFRPDDARAASRMAARGEIRRLSRGLYTANLDEPAEQLVRRKWFDVAALYFPGAVIVDRSAIEAGPSSDGSLFLDIGPKGEGRRPVQLPGLRLRPRAGPGPLPGDMPFANLHMAGTARAVLENLRPSRARSGPRRTLGSEEIERWLDRRAQVLGEDFLNELRDQARAAAEALGAGTEMRLLDALIGSLLGSRDAALATRSGQARAAGLAYDSDRLALCETLRAELASHPFQLRPEQPDPLRLAAFYESYFSNWIEGTKFAVEEAEQIVFEGINPPNRPADAHDVRGTFEVITDSQLRSGAPKDADQLEEFLKTVHSRVMAGRPDVAPGAYKERNNMAGATVFVRPELVRGTLREGFRTLNTLPPGLPRAIFAMFLISEVHPFADGNGRVARLLMNAELSTERLTRIMIPLPFRDDYLGALRALSRSANPRPLSRTLDRAQRWVTLMAWQDRDLLSRQLAETRALTPGDEGDGDVVLLDPGG